MSALPQRHEVDPQLTWDLSLLFETETAYQAEQQALATDVEAVVNQPLPDQQDFSALITTLETLDQLAIRISRYLHYSELALSCDYGDPALQARAQQATLFISDLNQKLQPLQDLLARLPESTYLTLKQQDPAHAYAWERMRQASQHQLAPEAEALLTALSPVLNLPYQTYEMAKLADLRFQSFTVAQQQLANDFVTFENDYQYETRTPIRRAAYQAFHQDLKQVVNTFATLYNAQVQKEKILSKARGYDSVIDYLLDEQAVSPEAYHRQIDTIYQRLGRSYQKYLELLKRVHGWDKITYADLKVPLDKDYAPQVSQAEAKHYVQQALSPLGEAYNEIIEEALDHRWIDWAKNQGKSTGGFCASPYGAPSYILLSWNGLLSEVFTLVHELGHAAHFHLAAQNQPYSQHELSLYLVEAPSTCNEMLLARTLLQQADEPRFKRWVLASMLENTYFHNFITHLLEAHYQRAVYQKVDQGESLTSQTLNELMKQTLQGFWGEAVEWVEGAELTWMRQPHYYMGLYPYTYSAGLTLSTLMSQRMIEEGPPAVEAWLDFLKAGGSADPVTLAQQLGVDLTTTEPVEQTLHFIETCIDEVITLTEQMEVQS